MEEVMLCKKQFMKGNRFNFTMAIVLTAFTAVFAASIAFIMMYAIDAVQESDFILGRNVMIGVVLLLVLYAIVGMAQKYFRNKYIEKGLCQFKNHIFSKILNKSISDYTDHTSGRLISAFSNDLSSIEVNYLNGTIQIAFQIILFIVAIISMAFINPLLTVCVLIACILPLILSFTLGKKLVKKEITTSDENESFVSQVKDLLNGFIVIKSFKAEKEVLELFQNRNVTLEEAKQERRDTNDTMALASDIANFIVVGVIFVIGAYLTYINLMTVSAIIAFVQLSNYLMMPIKEIVPLWSNRRAAVSLVEKIAVAIEADENQEVREQELTGFETEITIEDLDFSYDDNKTILKDVSLKLEKGRSYAIVGNSGSGKSTLLNLLLGYHRDYYGSVKIDEQEIRDVDMDSLYDVVSVVQQGVFLFDSTIIDNITMFKEFSAEKIERAIKLSGLKQLIEEKGADYKCGEDGKNLSGGEKQRISIARCLLRETPILIMDEATAALDNITSYEITNQIMEIDDLTRIIVTHKLDEVVLDKYDEIIVLKEGKVEEQGRFRKLLDQRGYFYSLYNIGIA